MATTNQVEPRPLSDEIATLSGVVPLQKVAEKLAYTRAQQSDPLAFETHREQLWPRADVAQRIEHREAAALDDDPESIE